MSSPEQQPNDDAPGRNNDDHDDRDDYRDDNIIMSSELEPSILVAYRSIGLGTFGAGMRYAGMPLEKIALFMNSSQVSGSNQFRQSVSLTFRDGPLAPYRVVGPASLVAWFMAYSVMGMSFQFFDRALSGGLGVAPVWYGKDVMDPPPPPPLLRRRGGGTTEMSSTRPTGRRPWRRRCSRRSWRRASNRWSPIGRRCSGTSVRPDSRNSNRVWVGIRYRDTSSLPRTAPTS